MKYLVAILCFFSFCLNAQTILHFDKRFVECEDKWVAFQKNKDSAYAYGFIYIDEEAGLTFNLEGSFTISGLGTFIPKKHDSTNVKIRLEQNQVKVAVIPATKYKELQITEFPEWLKYYKIDTASIERLYRWGFLYNSWGECAKALTYLERARRINAKFKGLEFELAYAYNDLEQYDKAIVASQDVIAANPDDCYAYKELSFAEMHLGQLDRASETCKKGISVCSDRQLKCEIAYNLAFQYYKSKDKPNFKLWADETKKWAEKNDQYSNSIDKMDVDLAK